ncbi:MAG: DUF3071 domain-containing protein [Propionibacteriales bacterium]|nr:DUF3071 domain-containing protein [Propionibacteriales bacterium]
MRKLELVGLDSEGRYVVFADDDGAEYAVPADDRLRAALRGDRPRLGQLEIDMDSALRPRDIQARVRAGETPEAVAVAAQVPVDKIMSYCVPVLAERRHIADLARRHHVRRKNAEGPARSLDIVVSERLRGRAIDPDVAVWDAWRRDDGRWYVRTTYQSGEREHSANFVFDAVGRYSLADDDEAKWLIGEQQSTRKGPQPREAPRGGERRLSAVRDGDDLLSLSDATTDVDDQTDDLTAVVRAIQEPEFADRIAPDLVEQTGAEPGEDADGSGDEVDTGEAAPDDTTDAATEGEPSALQTDPAEAVDVDLAGRTRDRADDAVEPTPDRRRKTARRSSVPSWDEIMFGKAKDDER